MFRRVIWIVLDSVGIGDMPDAADYGDIGSDTLGNLGKGAPTASAQLVPIGSRQHSALRWPASLPPTRRSLWALRAGSPGKDTTTGHWEMAGIHLAKPFPLYPRGFPVEVMDEFERRIGRSALGNRAASGTEIIKELGAEHVRTGRRSFTLPPTASFRWPRTKMSSRYGNCTKSAKPPVKFCAVRMKSAA